MYCDFGQENVEDFPCLTSYSEISSLELTFTAPCEGDLVHRMSWFSQIISGHFTCSLLARCPRCLSATVLSPCVSEHFTTHSCVSLIQRAWFIQSRMSSPWLWAVSAALYGKQTVKDKTKSLCIAYPAMVPMDVVFLLTCSGWHKLHFISQQLWLQKLHPLYESWDSALSGAALNMLNKRNRPQSKAVLPPFPTSQNKVVLYSRP